MAYQKDQFVAEKCSRSSHYYEDLFVIIENGANQLFEQVEGILYKIPAAIIIKRSKVLADMLSLPQDTNDISTREGQSDDNPIRLLGHSSNDFNCLMDWFFGGDDEQTRSISFLTAVLKMSEFFMIEDAKKYALARLEHHPDLGLAIKLQLCHRFNLTDWLEPAFRQLMGRRVQDVTNDEVDRLPIRVYHVFVKAKSDITNHRLSLAYSAPPIIIAIDCDSACACTLGWETAWKEGPANMFHHPDFQFSDRDVLERLESTQLPQVCEGCFRLSLENIKALGALTKEDRIVSDAIDGLKKWMDA